MEENSIAKINNLPDDCLMSIFKFLPIATRVHLELVCERWKDVSQSSWSDFKALHFHENSWRIFDYLPPVCRRKEGTNYKIEIAVQKTLERFGKYLTTIDFQCPDALNITPLSNFYDSDNYSIIHDVGLNVILKTLQTLKSLNNFQNIRTLKLFCFHNFCDYCFKGYYYCELCKEYCREIFRFLIYHADNIQNFSVDFDHFYKDAEYELSLMLACMENLKSLQIRVFSNCLIYGIAFTFVSPEVEELYLDPFRQANWDYLIKLLARINTLRVFVLRIPECEEEMAHILFEALAQHGECLKHLSFSTLSINNNGITSSTSFLLHVAKLKCLEKLSLSMSRFVDDNFLDLIGYHCNQLVYLDIEGCENITLNGILKLRSRLPNLQLLSDRDEYLNMGR